MCVSALTFTSLRFGFEDKSFGAGAGVGTRSVSAQTVVTEQTVHQTLVDVCRKTSGGTSKKWEVIRKVSVIFSN